MPNEDYGSAPMMLTRYTMGFEEVDYTVPLSSAFDATWPLQAIELEARAKSCAVIIQVALVPLEEIYGDLEEETEGDSEDE